MADFYFYLQKTNAAGVASQTASDKKNLESDFSGLKYLSCSGLESVGKPKNIYSESYAESNGERIFHPSDIASGVVYNESTNIELTLIFTGSTRRSVYESFVSFISSSRMFYWDTARNLKAWLVLEEAVEPSEDILKGDLVYIKATFKLKNLWGKGKRCQNDGTLITS